MVFLSVGIVDSGNFKGADAVEDLQQHTEDALAKYVDLAQRLGMPAVVVHVHRHRPGRRTGTPVRGGASSIPKAIFFAGQLVFQRDTWYQRLLHNETAYSLAAAAAMGRRADGDPADAREIACRWVKSLTRSVNEVSGYRWQCDRCWRFAAQ